MTSEGPTSDDRQRIEELEQEVARLRSRLDGGSEAGAADGDQPDGGAADAGGPGVDKVPMPNRTRVIVIAALAGLLALIAVVALVVGMSSVIDPFSKRAAKAISPWEPGDEQQPAPDDPEAPDPGWSTSKPGPAPPQAPAPPPAPDNVPRAPGL